MAGRNESARDERRGGGGRMLGMLLLAVLVALVLAYLGDCVPGFGVGGTSAPTKAEPAKAEPAKAEPAKAEAAPAILELAVDGSRCRRGGAALGECEQLCRELADEPKTQRVEIDGTLGTHAAVDTLRRCLAAHEFLDVVVRAD